MLRPSIHLWLSAHFRSCVALSQTVSQYRSTIQKKRKINCRPQRILFCILLCSQQHTSFFLLLLQNFLNSVHNDVCLSTMFGFFRPKITVYISAEAHKVGYLAGYLTRLLLVLCWVFCSFFVLFWGFSGKNLTASICSFWWCIVSLCCSHLFGYCFQVKMALHSLHIHFCFHRPPTLSISVVFFDFTVVSFQVE